LTHAVTGLQDGRQGQVNEMTELLVDMQSAYMRVGIALQQPNSTTAEPSKRLFGELAIASGLYDRAPLLAEPIQFAVDHYELANTRLIEARFARREMVNAWIGHLLETCIILLLIGELAALIYEITVFEPRLPDKSSAAATVTAVPEVPPAPAENTPAPQAAAPVQTVEPSPAAPAPKQPDAAAAPSPAAKPEAAQAPEATAKPSAVGAPRQWPNQPPRAQPTRRGAQKPSAWKAHKKASRKKIKPKAKPLHQSPNPALQQINSRNATPTILAAERSSTDFNSSRGELQPDHPHEDEPDAGQTQRRRRLVEEIEAKRRRAGDTDAGPDRVSRADRKRPQGEAQESGARPHRGENAN
jgi:hypothetical protein